VGHYVTIDEESVLVNRWDRPAMEEKYSSRSVLARLHEFHRHLEKATPDRSKNIINHVIRIFRQVRAALRDKDDGRRSLQILLYLLASSAVGEQRTNLDPRVLGLSEEAVERSKEISAISWDALFRDLVGTGRYDVPRPEIDLVLRHAAGSLFQEAHLEIRLPSNFWLPGLEQPGKIAATSQPTETGVYFTPPAIARTLAEEAIRGVSAGIRDSIQIFDPACGSGELLKECLRLLKLRGHQGPIRVVGWDRSDASVDMARFVLSWEKRYWPVGQVEMELTTIDSVTVNAWPSADLVIMNPPFQSWQQMEPAQQEAVTGILGAKLRNKPNLAMAFALRGLHSIKDGGVLAMVAPNSLLEAASGKEVREAMAAILSPLLVAKLGDQNIFARVLVDAGMYVGKREPIDHPLSAILWADSQPNSLSRALRGLRRWRGAEVEPLTDDGFSVYLRSDVGTTGAPWVARGYDAWVSYEQVRRDKRMVSAKKVFDIKQGVRLGNDVFVVAKDYIGHLQAAERNFFRPAVMNPSITNARLSDAYYVFYPYTTGLPEIETEQDLQNNVPTYFRELLLPAKNKLEARKSLGKSAGLKWWDLLWHRTWQEEQASRLVSKYFGGARSFAFDKKGDFVVVVGNAWLPNKGAIECAITDEEICFATLAYLNSSTAESLLQYVSVQVAGGQWDLSNRYVGELPVPNLAKMDAAEIAALVRLGESISHGELQDWDVVDATVRALLNR
jgi:predicted RNA methylase